MPPKGAYKIAFASVKKEPTSQEIETESTNSKSKIINHLFKKHEQRLRSNETSL